MSVTDPRLISVIDRDGYTLYPPHTEGTFRQSPSQRAELRRFAASLRKAGKPLEQKVDEYFERRNRVAALMASIQDDSDPDATQPVQTVIADEPSMEEYIKREVVILYSRKDEEEADLAVKIAVGLCWLCGIALAIAGLVK